MVFLLSLLESFAFVSLIVPATFILLGVGALIGAAGVGFLFAWAGAAAGAFAGDWAAFELAAWLGPKLAGTDRRLGDPAAQLSDAVGCNRCGKHRLRRSLALRPAHSRVTYM